MNPNTEGSVLLFLFIVALPALLLYATIYGIYYRLGKAVKILYLILGRMANAGL